MRDENLGVNEAIRRAGYVRIPAWWVLPDELEAIHRIAHNHEEEIKRIRQQARGKRKGGSK